MLIYRDVHLWIFISSYRISTTSDESFSAKLILKTTKIYFSSICFSISMITISFSNSFTIFVRDDSEMTLVIWFVNYSDLDWFRILKLKILKKSRSSISFLLESSYWTSSDDTFSVAFLEVRISINYLSCIS